MTESTTIDGAATERFYYAKKGTGPVSPHAMRFPSYTACLEAVTKPTDFAMSVVIYREVVTAVAIVDKTVTSDVSLIGEGAK